MNARETNKTVIVQDLERRFGSFILEILALEAGLLTTFGALMVLLANVKFTKKLV